MTRITYASLPIFALFLISAVSTAPVANAEEYVCTQGNDQRIIRLEFPGQNNLCEVTATYKNNQRKVVWLANSTSEFCSNKSRELIGKYRNQWGWSCDARESKVQIDTLSSRERVFIDDLVSLVVEQGEKAEQAFQVTGVYAYSNHLEKLPRTTMVVQLEIDTEDRAFKTDRTYVFEFDDSGYEVIALQIGLGRIIDTDEARIVGAKVAEVRPDGTFSVATTVVASTGDSVQNCSGVAVVKTGDDGKLTVFGEHQWNCPESEVAVR